MKKHKVILTNEEKIEIENILKDDCCNPNKDDDDYPIEDFKWIPPANKKKNKKDSLCNTCKNECKQASFATVMNCPYYEKIKDKEN